jgi:paraquat-inducible protein B
MSKKASPTFIGIFVLGAITLFFIGILIFGTGKFFSDRPRYVLYFEGRVKGLNVGADVAFRGVRIGNVTDIQMYFHPENLTVRIPVIIEIDPKKIPYLAGKFNNSEETARIITELVNNGLRAQLKLHSLVTGQLYVDFDFYPDREANFLSAQLTDTGIPYPELPTIPSEMEEIARVLGKLPIEALAYKALDAIEGIERMINSTEMKEGFAALTQTMKHVQELADNINQEIVPMAADTRELIKSLDGLSDNTDRVIRGVGDDFIQTFAGAKKMIENMETTLVNINGLIIPVTDEVKIAAEAAQTALDQANKTFMALEDIARKETPMGYQVYNAFDEFAAAARSIRNLAEYLERHPEALIQGKGGNR